MNPGVRYARGGAARGAVIGGLGLGALGAAINGLPKTHTNAQTGKKETLTNKQRVTKAVIGGLGSAVAGAYYGGHVGWNHRARKWNAGYRPSAGAAGFAKAKTPDWLKGVKTKSEGRKAFHIQARKHHPDLGGDPEVFKRISQEWEHHEPLLKQAMYTAFADELEKIAVLGALLGGYAGHKLSPKDSKSQMIGILGGAAIGHLTGAGLKASKRAIVDDAHEREARELYGYAPSPPPATNFY